MSYFETLYGEIEDLDMLINIVHNHTKNVSNTIFYDFGSGYGNITLHFHKYFESCHGIEIMKDRHSIAMEKNIYSNVYFYNQNFFDVFIENPCVVLLNNLCFGDGTNKRLGIKIAAEVHFGLILTTKKIDVLSSYYNTYHTIKCSWGSSEVYVYKF